jgi:hypothetical protein
MLALPAQPLLAVVGAPDVVRRQGVHSAGVGHRVEGGDLCPRTDPDALRLGDPAVLAQRADGRLAVGPHALLQRATELGLVGLPHEVVALVVERRIEKEAVVLNGEVPLGLAHPTLAQGDELLTLCKGADGDRPLLEGNWHKREKGLSWT